MTFRSLGISLLIHLFIFSIFLILIMQNETKKPSEPLTIHIATFIPQTTAPAPILPTPTPIVPPKQTPLPTMLKNTPLPPVAIAKPMPSSPPMPLISHPAPQLAQPQPIVQAPTPKVIETQKVPPAAPPPPAVNVEKEFLNAHLGEIRGQLLQNFRYPKIAQKLKMQGEVRVSFSLSSEGGVDNIKVFESSGFDILDEDAVALIQKTASTFPKPSKSVRITVPLSYVLR